MPQNENQFTPQQRAQNIAHLISQAQQACQADIQRIGDAQARVVFEGVSEMLDRAIKVLNEYSSGREHTLFTTSAERRPLSEETGAAPPTVTEFAVDDDSGGEAPPRIYNELPKE